jgi:hypothetical protein
MPYSSPRPSSNLRNISPSGDVTTPTLPDTAARRDSRVLASQTSLQAQPEWHIPVYGNNPGPLRSTTDVNERRDSRPRRVSLIPVGPNDERRDSDTTLIGEREKNAYKKYSMSSYKHPYDIHPPPGVYIGSRDVPPPPVPEKITRRLISQRPQDDELGGDDPVNERELKKRGILANYIDLYALDYTNQYPEDREEPRRPAARQMSRADSDYGKRYTAMPRKMCRSGTMPSMMSFGSEIYDPDDPKITGFRKRELDDQEDLEKNALRQMDYKARRKERQRIKIEFNICCMSAFFSLGLSASSHSCSYDTQTGVYHQTGPCSNDVWCTIPSDRVSARCCRPDP